LTLTSHSGPHNKSAAANPHTHTHTHINVFMSVLNFSRTNFTVSGSGEPGHANRHFYPAFHHFPFTTKTWERKTAASVWM